MEDDLKNKIKMKDDLRKKKIEDNLKKMKTTSKKKKKKEWRWPEKNEDDLNKKIFSLFLLNLGAKNFLGLAQLSKILFSKVGIKLFLWFLSFATALLLRPFLLCRHNIREMFSPPIKDAIIWAADTVLKFLFCTEYIRTM